MAKRKASSSKLTKWNSRIHYFLIAGFLLLILIPMINKTPSEEVSVQSTDAAVKFLYLVDNLEYAQSWEISSGHMQKALAKEDWSKKIAEMRDIVGPLVKRSRDDVTYLDTPADMPEGEYVVITFVSEFKNRNRVTESVTLYHGKNSQWQVAGYFLK